MNIDEIKSRIKEYKLQILDPIDKQGIEHIINARMGEINRPINLLKIIDNVLTKNENNIILPSRKGRVEIYSIFNENEQKDFPYTAARLVIGVDDTRIYSFCAYSENKVKKVMQKNYDKEWEEWNKENVNINITSIEEDNNTLSSYEVQNIIKCSSDNKIKEKIQIVLDNTRISENDKFLISKILNNEVLENGINEIYKENSKGVKGMDTNNIANGEEQKKTIITQEIIKALSEGKGYKPVSPEEISALENFACKGVVRTPEGKNGYKINANIEISIDEAGKVVVSKSPEVKFCALFFDNETEAAIKSKAVLPKLPERYHVTMGMTNANEVLANSILAENLGKEVSVKAFAEGNDSKNQGFAVKVGFEEDTFKAIWKEATKKDKATGEIKNRVPHITVSMAEDGKAVDTGYINFDKNDLSLEMVGTLGILVEVGLAKKEVIVKNIKDIENLKQFVKTYEVEKDGILKCINNKEDELTNTKAAEMAKNINGLSENLLERNNITRKF